MTTKLPTIAQLIESAAHFGHLKARSHPQARRFAFGVRDRVVLIDLDQTIERLKAAADYCRMLAKDGKIILFVGTKNQIHEQVAVEAKRAGMPYVKERWLAGTLTNFEQIARRVKQLETLQEASQQPRNITKREQLKLGKKLAKLHKLFDGLRGLTSRPDALLVVDASQEKTAVAEANTLGIPVVAIADTNVNPALVTYPVPANDDSAKSVALILGVLTDAVIEGAKKAKTKKAPTS